ncbi:MAG TPA: extracellular solute-binding protein [Polyangiaceae bacterium]|nr:extracellular solute-binding protein [Polyangiaceae bacterium]
MRRSLVPLAILLATLAVPLALRPRRAEPIAAQETLVILSPHNEVIRFEFERGFQKHMRARRRQVRIDWRLPGGTSEVSRFLASEYLASFERYWTNELGRPWSAGVARGFADPHEPSAAREAFLRSNVGCGIDLLFGGGSIEFIKHAAAGVLVDSGLVRQHPDLFGPQGIPQTFAGEPYWDAAGRWLGTCLSGYGICFNRDVLRRIGQRSAPASWPALAEPALFGQLALTDPTRSGAGVKTFEMLIQQQMTEALGSAASGPNAADVERRAVEQGWTRSLRLIRRIGANARYFSDAHGKIVLDIAQGDAAAGMCIDFFARFQSDVVEQQSGQRRLDFVLPRGGTSFGADPIALLRGAPHRELGIEFMRFVVSDAGQKIWSFQRGTPGGPERFSLRRLPISPRLYAPEHDAFRSDPKEHPYSAQGLAYREAWTGSLFSSIALVVRVMCIDSADELREAFAALQRAGFPPRATAAFDDVSLLDYAAVTGPIRRALRASDPLEQTQLSNRLIREQRAQYRRVVELAKAGR